MLDSVQRQALSMGKTRVNAPLMGPRWVSNLEIDAIPRPSRPPGRVLALLRSDLVSLTTRWATTIPQVNLLHAIKVGAPVVQFGHVTTPESGGNETLVLNRVVGNTGLSLAPSLTDLYHATNLRILRPKGFR